jgi:hypothetical protein
MQGTWPFLVAQAELLGAHRCAKQQGKVKLEGISRCRQVRELHQAAILL